ncbi:hypothetical protein [Nitratiruptor tergarcus]|uniref:CopZ zinc binding domain-containing protein n=1 Tax=Nitratiruptor tergarcus DSM 16512 TaxID=1069081 RepID=A0A1W1WS38_9BACT|nr:hypothetical protein [Nitratiruptor tergarcus]SMC08830.1 hypothetical protein SAMN05660197_0604 [Nitratiruptor tergarcus DSM 16512]
MQFFLSNRCPSCKSEGKKIKYENILANLRTIENIDQSKEYFYCKNPACDVVYFCGLQTWHNADLIRPTAAKSRDPEATVCYCFDYRIKDINTHSYTAYKEKKAKGCACSMRNPSGKCCHALFKSFL